MSKVRTMKEILKDIEEDKQRIFAKGEAIREARIKGPLAGFRRWWTGRPYGCLFFCKEESPACYAGTICSICGADRQIGFPGS